MDNEFKHHGILGQKWGVRRTPAQLGHVTGNSNSHGTGNKSSVNSVETKPHKSSGKSSKRPRTMSDDELRERINRLNMEEQYENLVDRQKQRSTSTVKRLLGEAAENLGRKALGLAVDKVIDKMKTDNKVGEKKPFDIKEWRNADVQDMDLDTIQNVVKWYENSQKITKIRESSPSEQKTTPVSNEEVRQHRAAMRQLGTR